MSPIEPSSGAALIVGLGTIGRRHLANLSRISPDTPVTIWHQHSTERDSALAADPSRREVFGLSDALASGAHYALITGPATTHVATASQLAAHGVHLLIEKPLSNQLDGVDQLLEICRRNQLTLLVGYNYRFYEPLHLMRQAVLEGRIGRVLSVRAEVGQYLPEWRPAMDYRRSTTARSELGGGVLLELSHEIDYVRWLVGEVRDVTARLGQVSDLETDVEDCAEIVLSFENDALGSIHLDMVQRAATRTCKIVGSEGTLVWDGFTHVVRCYLAATASWTCLAPASDRDPNQPYVTELRHFLECVRSGATPAVTGEDGRRALQIALAARQSSDERRTVTL